MPGIAVLGLGAAPADRLSLLQSFAADLAHAETAATAASLACATARNAFGCDGVVLMEPTADGGFTALGHAGYDEASVALFRLLPPRPEGPAHRAVRESRGIFIEDHASLRAQFPDYPPRTVNTSWAVVPGNCGSQRVILSLAFAQARTYPQADRAFLGAVADLCAQALHRTRLIEAERKARLLAEQQASWAMLQANLARELWLESSAEGILRCIARMAVPGLASAVAGDLVDNGLLTRIVIAHESPDGEERAWRLFGKSPQEAEGSLAAHVGRTGQARLVADATPQAIAEITRSAEPGRIAQLGARSLMSVPVAGKGGCRAVLTFVRSREPFGAEDLEEAKAIAVLAGFAIANVTLRQELREAATLRLDALRTLAHDVRGPLAVAMLRSSSMARKARAQGLDEAGAASWAAIERSLQRISSLTEHVMAAARDDANIAPEAVDVDVAATVREVVEVLGPLARDRRVEVAVELAPTIVRGDPLLVRSIVENLVSNAAKFTRPGGHVRISCAPTPASAPEAGPLGRLVVRDDGVGWRSDQQQGIFEAFARPNQGASGTGLGLYLARKSAHRMGGRLEAASPGPDLGATFTLELPLAAAAAGLEAAVAPGLATT